MCDIDVGKCCDIDVQEQAIELLIRNHGGDVLWPQLFAFSRRQTCVARKNWERAFVRGVMLLSAYRAGAECRLSQADAAWARNVIADSENFLPDSLREVP